MKLVKCSCGWTFDYERRSCCPGCGRDGQKLPGAQPTVLNHDPENLRASTIMLSIQNANPHELPIQIKAGADTFMVTSKTQHAFALGMLAANIMREREHP